MSHETSSTSEPRRLIDDPSIGSDLRHDLRAFAALPLAFNRSAGLASFEAALLDPQAGAHLGGLEEAGEWIAQTGGTGASSAAGAAKSPGLFATVSSKLVVAGLSVGLIGGVAYYEASQPQAATAPLVEKITTERTIQAAAPVLPLVEKGPRPTEAPKATLVETPVDLPTTARRSAPRRSKRNENAAAETVIDPREEARLVARARESLASAPQATLALLEEARQKFGKGSLGQERAGLRVLALFALDKTNLAKGEAEAYLAKYPQGPLAHRIGEKLNE